MLNCDRYATFYPDIVAAHNTSKMVNQPAFKRVNGLLQTTKGTIVCGGDSDEATKYIAPTIVRDVKIDDSLMTEWVFRQLFPIHSLNHVSERFSAPFCPLSP